MEGKGETMTATSRRVEGEEENGVEEMQHERQGKQTRELEKNGQWKREKRRRATSIGGEWINEKETQERKETKSDGVNESKIDKKDSNM